jgi:hypothetical protein
MLRGKHLQLEPGKAYEVLHCRAETRNFVDHYPLLSTAVHEILVAFSYRQRVMHCDISGVADNENYRDSLRAKGPVAVHVGTFGDVKQ